MYRGAVMPTISATASGMMSVRSSPRPADRPISRYASRPDPHGRSVDLSSLWTFAVWCSAFAIVHSRRDSCGIAAVTQGLP
jgi:hypothetical protein